MTGPDRSEQSSIRGVKLLIAVSPCAVIGNRLAAFVLMVRIAWVDLSEIREEGDQPALLLIDTIPYTMRFADFSP
jgi:hypothetical protein